jgi:hypothetical protein
MPPRSLIVVAALVTALSAGWLLSGLGVMPEVDWVWTLGLAVAGVLALALGGIDRFTMTVGPFLLIAAAGSLLRQSGLLPLKVEFPAVMMTFGLLLLVNLLLPIPTPGWMKPPPRP